MEREEVMLAEELNCSIFIVSLLRCCLATRRVSILTKWPSLPHENKPGTPRGRQPRTSEGQMEHMFGIGFVFIPPFGFGSRDSCAFSECIIMLLLDLTSIAG